MISGKAKVSTTAALAFVINNVHHHTDNFKQAQSTAYKHYHGKILEKMSGFKQPWFMQTTSNKPVSIKQITTAWHSASSQQQHSSLSCAHHKQQQTQSRISEHEFRV